MNKNVLSTVGDVARRFAHSSSREEGLAVQPMRRRHVRAIVDIENRVHPKPWTSGVFTSEIDLMRTGARYYVVAVRGGDLVGYGGLMFVEDEAHVTNIAVDPARRRQGVARRLLAHLVETAVERGAQSMTLEVRVSNEAALGLYRSFGFAPAGIRQKYYENSEDALVMWAHDIQGADYADRLSRVRGAES